MKIERDKVYLTRCGEKVRVVCVDATEAMPILGIGEHAIISFWTERGEYRPCGDESQNDLVSEYVEPPKPREVWVPIFKDGDLGYARTADEAADAGDHVAPFLVKFREVIEA